MPRTRKTTAPSNHVTTIPTVPEAEWPYPVPGNWRWVYGKSFLKPMEVKRPTGEFFKYIDIDSIDNKQQIVSEPKIVSTKDAPSRASRALHTGDTVFSMVRPYLKNIAYIDESMADSIASTGFYVCSPVHSVNPRYNYYMMVSPYVIDGLNAFMKGDNSPSIRKDDLENYPFPLPPLAEQQRIVDRIERLFTKLDEAREKAQAVVNGFENRKAAILHKAFTGELTKKWREERGIGMESWEKKKLGETGILERGRSKHRPRNDPSLFGGKYPFIQTGDIASAGQYITSHRQSLSEFGLMQSRLFPSGTLCITIAANIGEVAILSYDCCFPDSVVGFTPNGSILSEYVYYMMTIIQDELEANAPATAQKNINLKVLNDIKITVPSVEEQSAILEVVNDCFDKERRARDLAESVIAQIDGMKKAILARAFRGELGTNVPGEPACEV